MSKVKQKKEAEKRTGVLIPSELPNMPTGTVPRALREAGETVVRLEEDFEHIKNELKEERKKLLSKMVELEVPMVPVEVGNWKKIIRLKKSTGYELDIEDIGLSENKKEAPVKEPASAVG